MSKTAQSPSMRCECANTVSRHLCYKWSNQMAIVSSAQSPGMRISTRAAEDLPGDAHAPRRPLPLSKLMLRTETYPAIIFPRILYVVEVEVSLISGLVLGCFYHFYIREIISLVEICQPSWQSTRNSCLRNM